MGRMATKSVMRQSHGTNGANAIMIMPAILMTAKAMENLNLFKTLGTSMKKLLNSASFAVAPHVMSISNIWARSAWET